MYNQNLDLIRKDFLLTKPADSIPLGRKLSLKSRKTFGKNDNEKYLIFYIDINGWMVGRREATMAPMDEWMRETERIGVGRGGLVKPQKKVLPLVVRPLRPNTPTPF